MVRRNGPAVALPAELLAATCSKRLTTVSEAVVAGAATGRPPTGLAVARTRWRCQSCRCCPPQATEMGRVASEPARPPPPSSNSTWSLVEG